MTCYIGLRRREHYGLPAGGCRRFSRPHHRHGGNRPARSAGRRDYHRIAFQAEARRAMMMRQRHPWHFQSKRFSFRRKGHAPRFRGGREVHHDGAEVVKRVFRRSATLCPRRLAYMRFVKPVGGDASRRRVGRATLLPSASWYQPIDMPSASLHTSTPVNGGKPIALTISCYLTARQRRHASLHALTPASYTTRVVHTLRWAARRPALKVTIASTGGRPYRRKASGRSFHRRRIYVKIRFRSPRAGRAHQARSQRTCDVLHAAPARRQHAIEMMPATKKPAVPDDAAAQRT